MDTSKNVLKPPMTAKAFVVDVPKSGLIYFSITLHF
jgi:hypothetical protein